MFHASVQKWACLFNVGHVGLSWDLCFCEAEIKCIKKKIQNWVMHR